MGTPGDSPDLEASDENQRGSLDRSEGAKIIQEMILAEVAGFLDDIKVRNPKITDGDMVPRIFDFLRENGDPRVATLEDLYYQRIPSHEADQVLEVVQDMTSARAKLMLERKENSPADTATGLEPDVDLALRQSVKNFDPKKFIIDISVLERKNLRRIINTSIIANLALMLGERTEYTSEQVGQIYGFIEYLNRGIASGDHTIGLIIIGIFGYEALVKILEVGSIRRYMVNNKEDVAINILAVLEGCLIFIDMITHPGIASALRSTRAFRLIKVLSKNDSVRELTRSLQDVVPAVLKVSGIYASISLVFMAMIMEVAGDHVSEVSDISGALTEMRNLFLADGFQPLMESIETSETLDPISKVVASTLANIYMISSTVFYFAIPTALVADSVNKSGKRGEQMIALTLETIGDIRKKINDIGSDLKEALVLLREIAGKNKKS